MQERDTGDHQLTRTCIQIYIEQALRFIVRRWGAGWQSCLQLFYVYNRDSAVEDQAKKSWIGVSPDASESNSKHEQQLMTKSSGLAYDSLPLRIFLQ